MGAEVSVVTAELLSCECTGSASSLLRGSEFMSHLFSCQHGFIQCSFFLNLFHTGCRLFCCMLLMVLAATVVGRIRTESRRAFVLLDIIFTCELITETTLFQLPCYGDPKRTEGSLKCSATRCAGSVVSICRSYLLRGLDGISVFIGEAVADFLPVHFQLHRPGESVFSRSCRRVFFR